MLRNTHRIICSLASVMTAATALAAPQSDNQPDAAITPRTRNVAIVMHQGVELLDFAGPGEVFQAAARRDWRNAVVQRLHRCAQR